MNLASWCFHNGAIEGYFHVGNDAVPYPASTNHSTRIGFEASVRTSENESAHLKAFYLQEIQQTEEPKTYIQLSSGFEHITPIFDWCKTRQAKTRLGPLSYLKTFFITTVFLIGFIILAQQAYSSVRV